MKKILLLIAFVATGLFANAQGAMQQQAAPAKQTSQDATARATKITDKMTTALTLTADQKPKVMNINLEKAKAMDANEKKNGKDAKAFQAEKEKIHTKWEADLKGVLTAEQMTKFQKMEADQKAKNNSRAAGKDAK